MFMSWWLTRSPLVATLGQTFCLRSTLESTELPAEGGEERKRRGGRRGREGGWRRGREEGGDGEREEGERREGGREGGKESIEHDNQYKMLTIQCPYLHSICFVNGVHSLNHPTPALIGGEINQSQHSSGNYVKMEDRRQ